MLSLLHLRASELALCLLRCKLSGPRWLWEASQVARRGEQRCRTDPLSLHPAPFPVPQGSPRARGSPAQGRGSQGHAAGAHLELSRQPLAPPSCPRARGRGLRGWQGQGQWSYTYSDGSRLFLSMAEDIGEGGGVPGAGGAPFVARGWPAAGARTPSGARAPPPLLRLFLLGRSGGELAPPRSRTVAALPSNAKERERITGLPARRGRPRRGPGRAAWPRAAAAAAAAQDLTFHPGPAAATTAAAARSSSARALSPAPRSPAGMESARLAAWSPSHLPPGSLRSSPPRAGRGRQPGGGEGIVPLSPGSLLSREGLFSLSFPLSLVSFPFPDHDSNTIEGNHI